jgi:hypothetical protein
MADAPGAAPMRPGLGWKTPAGWKEMEPDTMRVASFSLGEQDGQHGEVAAIPIPGMKQVDTNFVNMWCQQLSVSPAREEDLPKMMTDVAIGDGAGKLVDVLATEPDKGASHTNRIIVAVVARKGFTWFFKLQGPGSLVNREQPAFLEFLKSVDFTKSDQFVQAAMASQFSGETPVASSESSAKPKWEVPEGWKEISAGQMVLSRFALDSGGGKKAEVTVSTAGGGLLLNVNRWRGQLGLPAIAESELKTVATPFNVPGENAVLVDMSGTDKGGRQARLIAVIVPRNDGTWFYKLMGDQEVAGRHKDTFLKFVQTVHYPNA